MQPMLLVSTFQRKHWWHIAFIIKQHMCLGKEVCRIFFIPVEEVVAQQGESCRVFTQPCCHTTRLSKPLIIKIPFFFALALPAIGIGARLAVRLHQRWLRSTKL